VHLLKGKEEGKEGKGNFSFPSLKIKKKER